MKSYMIWFFSLILYFKLAYPVVAIIHLPSERWQEYKALRLGALANDPEAMAVAADDEAKLPESYWRSNLENPYIFFAQEDGKLVGMVAAIWEYQAVTYCRHLAVVTGMYVAPQARAQGVGYALMQSLLSALESENKATLAMLWVTVSKKSAINLYEKSGFEKCGLLKDSILINGKYLDSFLMQKTIVK